VDLCHEVRPHDIVQAGFMLRASFQHFPPEYVFLCISTQGWSGRTSCYRTGRPRSVRRTTAASLLPSGRPFGGDQCRLFRRQPHFSRPYIFAGLAARLALGSSRRPRNEDGSAGIIGHSLPGRPSTVPVLTDVVPARDRVRQLPAEPEPAKTSQRDMRLDDAVRFPRHPYADLPPPAVLLSRPERMNWPERGLCAASWDCPRQRTGPLPKGHRS
jgi:hypothetical protein